MARCGLTLRLTSHTSGQNPNPQEQEMNTLITETIAKYPVLSYNEEEAIADHKLLFEASGLLRLVISGSTPSWNDGAACYHCEHVEDDSFEVDENYVYPEETNDFIDAIDSLVHVRTCLYDTNYRITLQRLPGEGTTWEFEEWNPEW